MKKTFKLLLSAAILFSATLSANAQLLKKEKFSVPDPMHFGVRGGSIPSLIMKHTLFPLLESPLIIS